MTDGHRLDRRPGQRPVDQQELHHGRKALNLHHQSLHIVAGLVRAIACLDLGKLDQGLIGVGME